MSTSVCVSSLSMHAPRRSSASRRLGGYVCVVSVLYVMMMTRATTPSIIARPSWLGAITVTGRTHPTHTPAYIHRCHICTHSYTSSSQYPLTNDGMTRLAPAGRERTDQSTVQYTTASTRSGLPDSESEPEEKRVAAPYLSNVSCKSAFLPRKSVQSRSCVEVHGK